MSRPLKLTEYQTTYGVALSEDELHALQAIAPSVAVAPSAQSRGAYDLTPSSEIGTLILGDLRVLIHPKIPMENVFFLLCYAADPRLWWRMDFQFETAPDLLEAVAPAFIHHVRNAFRRGLLQGYLQTEESLYGIRGRLRFEDQLRNRYGIFPPAEVRFDDYTEDIEENRLIRAAVEALLRLRVRLPRTVRELRTVQFSLREITRVAYSAADVPEIHYSRLNEHYRPALNLAALILQRASFHYSFGSTDACRFLVDMNQVFEDFVVVALRSALGLNERRFPQGARGRRLRLDEQQRIRLRPDVSWWENGTCCFVADVKYKRVSGETVPNADLYQLLAYLIAADLPSGMLIYAAGEAEPFRHTIPKAGKQLEIVTLNLNQRPQEILQDIERLAARIRTSRISIGIRRRSVYEAARVEPVPTAP